MEGGVEEGQRWEGEGSDKQAGSVGYQVKLIRGQGRCIYCETRTGDMILSQSVFLLPCPAICAPGHPRHPRSQRQSVGSGDLGMCFLMPDLTLPTDHCGSCLPPPSTVICEVSCRLSARIFAICISLLNDLCYVTHSCINTHKYLLHQ